MENYFDTWRDRNGLLAYAYGVAVIELLTTQMVARRVFNQLNPEKKDEVLKLIKNFHWKKSKSSAASVIEAICRILNPKQEIACLNGVLDSHCFRNSFYGGFGLNHVFAVIFSPILVNSQSWQEEYYVNVKNVVRGVSLSKILNLHNKILLWHKLCDEKRQVEPIFGFDKDFVRRATMESADFELTSDDENKTTFGAITRAIKIYEEEKNAKFNGKGGLSWKS